MCHPLWDPYPSPRSTGVKTPWHDHTSTDLFRHLSAHGKCQLQLQLLFSTRLWPGLLQLGGHSWGSSCRVGDKVTTCKDRSIPLSPSTSAPFSAQTYVAQEGERSSYRYFRIPIKCQSDMAACLQKTHETLAGGHASGGSNLSLHSTAHRDLRHEF